MIIAFGEYYSVIFYITVKLRIGTQHFGVFNGDRYILNCGLILFLRTVEQADLFIAVYLYSICFTVSVY
ncbi:MAG: hypothetical protein IJY74_01465 [Oscillospiraceae bacterium]|nr:hypothetical protein [Oscillospiraceae bacterium]